MGNDIIDIQLSKGYLDLSRASLYAFRNANRQDRNEWNTSAVALASSVIIPAYAAVEAFVNRDLLHVYEAMEILDAGRNPAGSFNIAEIRKFQSAHHECLGDFKSFLKTDKLYTLKGRINMLCKFTDTPRLCDINGKLWAEFLDYFGKYRHFFVHVDSSRDAFNDHVTDVLDYRTLSRAPELAVEVIKHFYVSITKVVSMYLQESKDTGGLHISLEKL